MAVNVGWVFAEKRALLVQRTEYWTWDEAQTTTRQILSLLDGAGHGVSLIYDFRAITRFPPIGFSANMRDIITRIGSHPNLSRVLLVVTDPDVHTLLETAYRLYGGRDDHPLFVQTMDKARQIIDDDRFAASRG